MKRSPLRSICLVLATVACTGTGSTRPGVLLDDAALSPTDISAVLLDAPTSDRGAVDDRGSSADTIVPATDADANGIDTSVPATDAGFPETDTSAPAPDAGANGIDTSVPAPDAGANVIDTSVPAPDAGANVIDTSVPATDAGECAAGLASCGAAGAPLECADLRVNTLHCGACGVRCCGVSDRCVAGVCTSRCPTLMVSCPASPAVDAGCVQTRCIDTSVDDLNCGACGNACADGAGCVSGRCI